METVLLRTFIVYILILLSIRLMGKRQLGQLQVSEFITAVVLSEVASLPITDRNTPLLYGVVPLLVIISLEVLLSFLSMKWPGAQKFLEGTPTILVEKGQLKQNAFRDVRITLRELLVELRVAGLLSISEAEYVILEPNGKFSIIPTASCRSVTNEDAKITSPSPPILDYPLIIDGKVADGNLSLLGLDRQWLSRVLNSHDAEEVFLMTCNELNNYHIIWKERSA